MKNLYSFVDKKLANPTAFNLTLLNKILSFAIPFNAPHKFKIIDLGPDAIRISLPNKRINHNHLQGVHACAMATVGEYCAGMALLKTFGISKYRLILSNLNVQYLFQGRTDLIGECQIEQINKENIRLELEEKDKTLVTLKTIIRDKNVKEVAIIETSWQLKKWSKVKTKS